MKNRLTNRAESGFVYCTQCCINQDKDCVEQDCFKAILDRLAAYEDSQMTPEEVQELAKAKAEGRLVVLPCKVKDMVYYTLCGRIFPVTVKQFRTNALQEWKVVIAFDSNYKEILDCVDFGKTVFLTREEAEKVIGGKEDA